MVSNNGLSDEQLMELVAQGNNSAFNKIFDRYYSQIYNFVRKNLYFDDIASEDVTQEIFLRLFKSSKSFDPERKLFSWVYQIAINEVRRYHKQAVRKRAHSINEPITDSDESNEKGDSLASPQLTPEEEATTDVRSRLIAQAIEQLPDKQRMVVLLKVYQQLTFEEISAILDCPLSTVISRMRYAVRKLKETLDWQDFSDVA